MTPQGRASVYPALVGLTVGMLLTGLTVPFVVTTGADGANPVATEGSALDPTGPLAGDPGQPLGGDPGSDPPSTAAGHHAAAATDGRAPMAGAGAETTSPDGAEGSADHGSPTSPDSEGLRATDRGVGPSEIRLGILLLQVSSVQRLGATVDTDPERQRRAWQAYIDEVNDSGGIHGRKVEPVYRSFDVLDADSMQAACLYLTQDEKVFAVLGQFNIPTGTVCLTRQNETPFLSSTQNNPDEVYETAGGRLFTLFPRGSRMMTSFAAEITRGEAMRGKRIGLLGSANVDSRGSVLRALSEALRARGADVVETYQFSADTATAQTQVPTALQKMRTSRVDTVVWLAFAVTMNNFTQQADGQGYRPGYFVTDWNNVAQDSGPRNNGAGFDGAIAVTFGRTNEHLVGMEPNTEQLRCREVYRRRTGNPFAETGSPQWGLDMQNCTLVRLATAGLDAAGPDLTRAAFSAGMQRTGPLPTTNWGGGRFGTGKFDFSDLVRRMRWEYGCKCWKPLEQFHPPGG